MKEKNWPKVVHSSKKAFYKKLKENAIQMRNHPTPAEAILWKELSNKKLSFKFRRQHIIDKFIVDFYCIQKGLIIEVDGDIHDLQKEKDLEREMFLKDLGCTIIRFPNEEVLYNLKSVLIKISQSLNLKE